MSYREQLLHHITNRIRQSLELPEILNTAVAEIRAFLEVDRVKIYRFDLDHSGEVIAEAIHDHRLPSLLNLRFPAEDIPLHARELFVKARQRVIVNVATQRKTTTLLDSLETGESLAVHDIRYALVDPCHAQYLTTMGVVASLTIPILDQQSLWGLLAIHHSESHLFAERELEIVQLLVDQVSIAIAQSNLLSRARQQAHYEATINQVSSLLHCPLNAATIRQGVLEAAVEALHGSGGRLYIAAEPFGEPAQFYTTGEQPTLSFIEETPFWQALSGQLTFDQTENALANAELLRTAAHWNTAGGIRIYTLPELRETLALQPLAAALESTRIRAIAMIPLQFHHQFVGCLSIFRNGYDTEIMWAGQRHLDDRNAMPRASFAAWRELKVDQTPVWSQDDIKLAQSIGLHLYMAVTQKRVESMMRYQASHDALTRLPNRLLFNQQISLALVNAQQQDEMVGVAFLDLDRFKTVNDTLGHAVGDQLLQQVAARLQACLRDCDVIARWGGDEFTLLLPHLNSAEDVTIISQRILEQLSIPFNLDGQDLYVTASLGIALSPYDGEDAETLLKHADTAMYRAKQRGKNTYQLFVEEMNQQALEQLALENDLRKAIARAELMLYYQPQVDIHSGDMIGLEALLRWQHAQAGFISPVQFIPIAEETGLICDIGTWALRTACLQQQAWQAAGLPPVRVAVNLSARQFQQADLVDLILQILLETGANPHNLEVEITESVAMQDVEFSIAMLEQLHHIGLQITVDDFGTGYSSLNAIKHFPLHSLKLDQSFVQDLVTSSSDAAIARAVVALGKGLELKTVAEGVETEEQLEFLRAIECDGAQGYLFSQPLPAAEMTGLLTRCFSRFPQGRSPFSSRFSHLDKRSRQL